MPYLQQCRISDAWGMMADPNPFWNQRKLTPLYIAMWSFTPVSQQSKLLNCFMVQIDKHYQDRLSIPTNLFKYSCFPKKPWTIYMKSVTWKSLCKRPIILSVTNSLPGGSNIMTTSKEITNFATTLTILVTVIHLFKILLQRWPSSNTVKLIQLLLYCSRFVTIRRLY